MTSSAIIIGAGIGGLSAAIHLRLNGYKVNVIERLGTPGGRCNKFELNGFHFDTGPTLLMMVEELKKLFSAAGKNIQDYIELVKLDPHSKFKFHDGSQLCFSNNLESLMDEFEHIETGSSKNLSRWISDNQRLFKVGMSDFIDRNSPNFISALKPENLAFFLKGQVTAPIYSTLDKYFKDNRLKDALAFSSLYLGMNPFETPSIYSVLPYAELTGGLFFPKGGMYQIASGIEKLATDIGVNISYNTTVTGLASSSDKVLAVNLSDKQNLEADLFVSNADLPVTYRTLVGEDHPSQKNFSYSCGAFLIYFGLKSVPSDTHHHQCFFPKSFKQTMNELFKEMVVPKNPVFYTCCPTVTDNSLAPDGMHSFTVLVPVPSNEGINWAQEKKDLRNKIVAQLCNHGFPENNIVVEKIVTPEAMGIEFNLANNAAFGLSHQLKQMGPLRPKNKHHKYENLYFVGASTHPGNGIPMVLISGSLTAKKIIDEHPLARYQK